jgi:hypothetical protein
MGGSSIKDGQAADVRIDDRVARSLWNHSRHFINVLGKPQHVGSELRFPTDTLPFMGLNVRYEIDKKFLGRIYGMVLEGIVVTRKEIDCPERMELRYSGFFRKGRSFFASLAPKPGQTERNDFLKALNEDRALMETCGKLEIEFFRLSYAPQGGLWRIEVRPYGGSYVHVLFPPMRYPVDLPREQAELILTAMKRTAHQIGKIRDK